MARTTTRSEMPPADDHGQASKFTAPRLPAWVVARARLDRRIADGARGPLTVVTGPPGAGKTMALASWAAASTAPGCVAWVTLDDYDNQPGSFWSSVLTALRQAGAAAAGIPPALPQEGAGGRAFLARLAAALAALDPPLVLVLDDLHLLTAPGPVEELAYVLKYARPGLRLVAAARIDPHLPLHRHRLAGELTEIRAAELAFTVPEAAQLMAQHGLTLPAGAVDLITGRVEGWAAGLRLAALSLDGHPDPGLFIKNLAAEDNALTSYLVDEVLDAQTPAGRELMQRTSILDRVSAELARELTGDEQAGATLAALAGSGAFIQPLGQGWYRCHAMFAEVLRLKLRRESPALTAGLHRRAAGWYQRSGLLGKAVAHAAQIGDWELAAQITVGGLAVGELLRPRGGSPVADSLRRMPPPEVRPDRPAQPPALLAAAALEWHDGRGQAAGRLLAAAEKSLDQLPPDHQVPSRLAAAMLHLAASRRSGDLDAARSAATRALALFQQLPPSLRRQRPETHAQVLSGRGAIEFWSGHPDAAAEAFAGAAATAPEGSWERAACLGHLALIEALRGRLSRAAELAGAGTNPAAEGPAVPPASPASVALALVHLERNELNHMHSRLKQADAALSAYPDRLIGAVAGLVAARGAVAQANEPAAAELTARARENWSPPPWLDHLLTVTDRGLRQPGPVRRSEIPARPASTADLDPVIVEQLSDREREVLRLVSSLLSTEEIAGALYLSVNTVKTHLKSIFRKLGATRRGEAVRRAKTLGMI